MIRIRLSILIPLLLILSSVAGSTLLFWEETRVANRNIQRAGIDNLHASLTHLQNMLNTQLAADSLEDARLSLSVSALHPGIRTLLLADENNRVMLANRYIWEGNSAPRVSGYVEAIARQVRQTQASSISLNANLLHGYFPVTLRLVAGGVGVDRVGVLFVEYDLVPQFAQARHNAVVQASLVGGLMLAVAIAVAILLHLLVSRRVKKIVEVSQRFAAGDMDVRVHLRGHDELAEIGHAFDDMAGQRKIAQEEVVQLSLQNKLILDSTGEGIYGLDTHGRCTFVNPAALQLLGFKVEELLGQHIHTAIHHTRQDGSPYPEEACPILAVYKQGVVHRGNDLHWRKDGSSFPVEYISTPILEAGKITGAVVVFRDITERKLDEEALHRLNRELRAISNCNETLMRAEDEQALLDDICRIICDDAGYRMAWVGFAENDEAKTIRPVAWAGVEDGYLAQAGIRWADTERGRGPSGIAIRSGESSCIQDFSTDPKAAPWRDAAMQRGYRSSISMPLKDESTNTFGILTIYSSAPHAFTPEEKRLLEELAGDLAFGIMVLRARIERKRAEESLRLMNERYALSTRAGRLGVWDWDLQKNELVWDDRMYELYGVKREEFSGAYEAWLQGIHPDDRVPSDEISKQAQSGEREYDTEFRVVWPDGSIHYLKAYGQFVRDAEGKPLRMTGVNFDITGLKEAENKVNELNRDLEKRVNERTAQLEEANKELEAFSYSVSHDLRTPLRAIDGFSHILLEDYSDKLDDEGKRLLNVVRDNTCRMGQLIDDILKFSRAGRLELNFSEIDMEHLAHFVFEELQPSVTNSKLQMEIEHLPPARGDSAMMRQVFVNLLSNAIKFSRNNAIPKIQVGVTVKDDETIYYVKDNGAGFDMQYSDKLFGVFQRLHSMNEFEGTGIGLAIVKRIIARHGGRVWAEGKVGEGATFYFSLPRDGIS
ncbi:MAG: PAS domain S-box protein [Gammaproteobacteria bacterium]|nr:PAS domain S-box protein [Gammaproteobacteria bacterium]MBU1775086.1 PAS domain S-box protein [Gammaproteobacteria bacterium]MBU1969256.1 PAS domain S-box protein [Gammaproteobacteria bacterium]